MQIRVGLKRAHLVEPEAAPRALVQLLLAAHNMALHVHKVGVYARRAGLIVCVDELYDLEAPRTLQTVTLLVLGIVVVDHVLVAGSAVAAAVTPVRHFRGVVHRRQVVYQKATGSYKINNVNSL